MSKSESYKPFRYRPGLKAVLKFFKVTLEISLQTFTTLNAFIFTFYCPFLKKPKIF